MPDFNTNQIEPMKPRLPSVVREETVIYTETVIGTGVSNDDPCRLVKQYWSKEGELIATRDLWAESQQHHPSVMPCLSNTVLPPEDS